MQDVQERIVKAVSSWEGITTTHHRFGGTEFKLGSRQIGHIHGDYFADIAFPMNVRNQLVSEGRAEPHHILPKSGWITFRFNKSEDIENGIELSYHTNPQGKNDLRSLRERLTCKNDTR